MPASAKLLLMSSSTPLLTPDIVLLVIIVGAVLAIVNLSCRHAELTLDAHDLRQHLNTNYNEGAGDAWLCLLGFFTSRPINLSAIATFAEAIFCIL